MTEVIGKNGISAKIVLDSVSVVTGDRLTTMEITYPRFILAEFNTHRMFSRNSASSRAIPFAKMQENLTALPVRFGQANKGMQDTGVDYAMYVKHPETCFPLTPYQAWEQAGKSAQKWSEAFHQAGFHKQIFNRLSESHQMMKTVVSATEWSNFFWLRDDEAADPSIAELARCMKQAYEQSEPQLLQAGEYHLPYIGFYYTEDGQQFYLEYEKGNYYHRSDVSLEDAIKVSCARACAVSFRNTDYGLEKSAEVYERLISDSKIHGSALEHAAKVMEEYWDDYDDGNPLNDPYHPSTWEEGISHSDRKGNLWSGNYRGFLQHRKTIKGECYGTE